MQIVIEIPSSIYEKMMVIKEKGTYEEEYLKQIILDGTPLPKGHGRLVDVDDLDIITVKTDDYSGNEVIDIVLKEDIDDALTIIEADKTESEELNEKKNPSIRADKMDTCR